MGEGGEPTAAPCSTHPCWAVSGQGAAAVGPCQLCLGRGAPTSAWPRGEWAVCMIDPTSLAVPGLDLSTKFPAEQKFLFYFPKPLLRLVLSTTFC